MKRSANKATPEDLKKITGLIEEYTEYWNNPENDPDANIVAKGNHKTGEHVSGGAM